MNEGRRSAMRACALACVLGAITFLCFWQVVYFPFVNLDDPDAVTDNRFVVTGFTREGVARAFTNVYPYQLWFPLTILSHTLDVELFGPKVGGHSLTQWGAGGHHLMNLLLHAASVVLLFLALRRMTGNDWPSAFVAALVAVHPLNVEPVVWITGRKDILCAFFFILMLWFYGDYVARRSAWRYIPVAVSCAACLASKSMLVTAPCLLLLLDHWPLRRFGLARGVTQGMVRRIGWLILEKAPLFGLSVVCAVLGLWAEGLWMQPQSAAQPPEGGGSLGARMANASVAYVWYLGKTFCPTKLAPIYPRVAHNPVSWTTLGCISLLLVVSLAAVGLRKRQPYCLVGWLWFLISLAPVMGLIQRKVAVEHLVADRYAYVPLIGLFAALVWGGRDNVGSSKYKQGALGLSGATAIVILAVMSVYQTLHWRSTEALMRHTNRATSDNFLAHLCLGNELLTLYRPEEAMVELNEALRIRPSDARTIKALGVACIQLRDYATAVKLLTQAVKATGEARPGYHLAVALHGLGRDAEAIAVCKDTLARPADPLDVAQQTARQQCTELLAQIEGELARHDR